MHKSKIALFAAGVLVIGLGGALAVGLLGIRGPRRHAVDRPEFASSVTLIATAEEGQTTESTQATSAEPIPSPVPNQFWPRFRGPDGSGATADDRVPTQWSDNKNVRWKVPLPGPGASSPIVWDYRIFVTCFSGVGKESGGRTENLQRHLVCIDRQRGGTLWSKEVPAVVPEDPYRGYLTEHGYASSTPATDGERVYVFFGKTGVLAFDFDGNQLWKTSVGTGSADKQWGSAASPILYKNLVIVNAAEESHSLQALDKRTGDLVWKTEAGSLEYCYGTPQVVARQDSSHELVISVPGEVWGLNPDTGKLFWFAKTNLEGNVSPSVVAKDDLLIAFGGYPGTASVALRAGGNGDVTDTHVLWSSKHASYVSSPVIHGDHVYWVNDRAFAFCVELATGKLVYQKRLPLQDSQGTSRPVYASTLLAAGRYYGVTRWAGAFVGPSGIIVGRD